jgi:hypothetical protein
MLRTQLDYDGLRGMLRLFLLALILALVLWWAVAVSGGPSRTIAKPVPRKPEKRPRRIPGGLMFDSGRTSITEVVLLDLEEIHPSSATEIDDYWPDIIDA